MSLRHENLRGTEKGEHMDVPRGPSEANDRPRRPHEAPRDLPLPPEALGITAGPSQRPESTPIDHAKFRELLGKAVLRSTETGSDPVSEFANRLRGLIDRANIPNKAEFAQSLWVSPATYYRWRQGKSTPAWDDVERLFERLAECGSPISAETSKQINELHGSATEMRNPGFQKFREEIARLQSRLDDAIATADEKGRAVERSRAKVEELQRKIDSLRVDENGEFGGGQSSSASQPDDDGTTAPVQRQDKGRWEVQLRREFARAAQALEIALCEERASIDAIRELATKLVQRANSYIAYVTAATRS